ncbi:oxidoreductase-like protein [Phycomyces blakesleeanus]|uniref:Oxidoreductase-like domain-containing protein n=2 Tax=Phycomyces blakesleeanus TaxID=4837 RepID=A0A163DN12_PHYB8|nr:hypothetical protein PHYBLDRAFT_146653 [Phycomyces blakesleeanus NRRL 1555(-)]OAD72460.1 hypothetical protein PHYBLDRAFT_146653 [Phycomyces blakesleeanus NRRL 1555(-)]|eukprot:XP_018290500.1 hypothetical protein PHYBLDRAFT_146653 [Phycomyces blakesleeanus NRRL 1555(-)]
MQTIASYRRSWATLVQPSFTNSLFRRRHYHQRVPNYDGWWTHIMNQPGAQERLAPIAEQQVSRISPPESVAAVTGQQEAITSFSAAAAGGDATQSTVSATQERKPPKEVVLLKGEPIPLPDKPEAPENCCMSGCAHCVWDMYQEDMEDFQAKREAIRQRFEEAGEPLPAMLGRSNKSAAREVEEAMDPTMRAFLEMERKMNKNKKS